MEDVTQDSDIESDEDIEDSIDTTDDDHDLSPTTNDSDEDYDSDDDFLEDDYEEDDFVGPKDIRYNPEYSMLQPDVMRRARASALKNTGYVHNSFYSEKSVKEIRKVAEEERKVKAG